MKLTGDIKKHPDDCQHEFEKEDYQLVLTSNPPQYRDVYYCIHCGATEYRPIRK